MQVIFSIQNLLIGEVTVDLGPCLNEIKEEFTRWEADETIRGKSWLDALAFLSYEPSSTKQEMHSTNSISDIQRNLSSSAKGLQAAIKIRLQKNEANESHDSRIRTFHLFLALRAAHAATSAAATLLNSKSYKSQVTQGNESSLSPERFEESVTKLLEAKVHYVIGVPPLDGNDPFLRAFCQWLEVTLLASGMQTYMLHTITIEVKERTQEIFRAQFFSETSDSRLLRDYLAIEPTPSLMSAPRTTDSSSTGLEEALQGWLQSASAKGEAKEKAWERYRADLLELPDARDTMFNESFGVRTVFQPPVVAYHVNGRQLRPGKPDIIEDVFRLFGGLLSQRVSSKDLIILSGGPGSGKSTFCRVLASQLASVRDVHPIFLRLKRAKDATDINAFIEDELVRQGIIGSLADLRELNNVILILDGFDELAMSSINVLRRFFNNLHDELSSGPLGKAKVIVSGRDTLFPNGKGMPTRSHVLTLQPFDRDRVQAWGKNWRRQHPTGPGSNFTPEKLLSEDGKDREQSPLQHLVTWPLTLHLLAQIHTTGRFHIGNTESVVEKAYLYRAILFETAERQEWQKGAEGGRLAPDKMRKFLRKLAWEMFLRSVDSMEPVAVMPILREFYRDENDTRLSELAEVAVVNAPELTRGEETRFEFVHKSFSEFLVAEYLAGIVGEVCHKVEGYSSEEKTWMMSDEEAASALAPALATRLLPQEVQEMLEPMLGGFKEFSKGNRVDDIVSPEVLQDGLGRVVHRMEELYRVATRGAAIRSVTQKTQERSSEVNPLETYANYCAGTALLGSAGARRLMAIAGEDQEKQFFHCEAQSGLFWRFLAILQAGGITLDHSLGYRLFNGATLHIPGTQGGTASELDYPLSFSALRSLDGFKVRGDRRVRAVVTQVGILQMYRSMLNVLADAGPYRDPYRDTRREQQPLGELLDILIKMGICSEENYFSLRRVYDIANRFEYSAGYGSDRAGIEVPLVALREALHHLSREVEYQSEYTSQDFLPEEYAERIAYLFERYLSSFRTRDVQSPEHAEGRPDRRPNSGQAE